MQPEDVQEALEAVHAHQDNQVDRKPNCKSQEDTYGWAAFDCWSQEIFVKDFGKLTVCQAQSPEPEIACGIGDGPKAKFDSLYELMY